MCIAPGYCTRIWFVISTIPKRAAFPTKIFLKIGEPAITQQSSLLNGFIIASKKFSRVGFAPLSLKFELYSGTQSITTPCESSAVGYGTLIFLIKFKSRSQFLNILKSAPR